MRRDRKRIAWGGVSMATVCLAAVLSACGGDDVTGPDAPPGALRFSSVTAGYFHTCGLTPEGRAYCWGGNAWGTLGDGSTTASNRPVLVSGPRFTSIESGAGHTCA